MDLLNTTEYYFLNVVKENAATIKQFTPMNDAKLIDIQSNTLTEQNGFRVFGLYKRSNNTYYYNLTLVKVKLRRIVGSLNKNYVT